MIDDLTTRPKTLPPVVGPGSLRKNLHSWLISSQNRISENIQGIFDGISAGNLFLEQLKVETSDESTAIQNETLGEDALSILNQAIDNLKNNSEDLKILGGTIKFKSRAQLARGLVT